MNFRKDNSFDNFMKRIDKKESQSFLGTLSKWDWNDGFYSSDRLSTSIDAKYRTKSKFPAKVLVWVVISENGRSNAYLAPKTVPLIQKFILKSV